LLLLGASGISRGSVITAADIAERGHPGLARQDAKSGLRQMRDVVIPFFQAGRVAQASFAQMTVC
jgi:hypothetical protein